MEKIGILTFHRATSYGAGFQAYALQQYLIQAGYANEILDYVPYRFQFRHIFDIPNADSLLKKSIKFLPYVISQIAAQALTYRFCRKYLELGKPRYTSAEQLENSQCRYQTLMTGSDQVWNLRFDAYDHIRPYLLSFADTGVRKISYAASIGMEDFSGIPDLVQRDYISLLKQYDRISVRENSAKRFLEKYGVASDWVLDPTFLLTSEKWSSIARAPKRAASAPFIFVYGLYRNKNLDALAHRIAAAKGYKIINVADGFNFCRKAHNDLIIKHEELLWYIQNAKCVITDSFHGSALSVNFNTPVYIFKAKRYNSRIESLIALLHLEKRVAEDYAQVDVDSVDMVYTDINRILEKERKNAEVFLKSALQ